MFICQMHTVHLLCARPSSTKHLSGTRHVGQSQERALSAGVTRSPCHAWLGGTDEGEAEGMRRPGGRDDLAAIPAHLKPAEPPPGASEHRGDLNAPELILAS